MSILKTGAELDVNIVESDRTAELARITELLIDADVNHYELEVFGALTEPIDDPDAKDPNTIHEAQAPIYWAEWLGAIYKN